MKDPTIHLPQADEAIASVFLWRLSVSDNLVYGKHANLTEQADCRLSFRSKWRCSNRKMELTKPVSVPSRGGPGSFHRTNLLHTKSLHVQPLQLPGGQDILLHTFFRVKVRTKWPGMSSSHPSSAVLCADAFCAVHVMELGIESSSAAKGPMPSKFAKLNVK